MRIGGILHIFGMIVTVKKLVLINMAGTFFNNFMPTSIGGDAYKFHILDTQFVGKRKEILSSLLIDRVIGLLSFLVINLIAATYLWSLWNGEHTLVVLEIAILAFLGVLLLMSLRGGYMLPFLRRLPIKFVVYKHFLDILLMLHGVRLSKQLIPPLIFSVVFILNVVLSTWFLFVSFGLTVPILYIALIVSITNIAGILPISLNSIGVTEGLYVFLLAVVGVAPETALAVALVGRVSLIITSAIGGVVYGLSRDRALE